MAGKTAGRAFRRIGVCNGVRGLRDKSKKLRGGRPATPSLPPPTSSDTGVCGWAGGCKRWRGRPNGRAPPLIIARAPSESAPWVEWGPARPALHVAAFPHTSPIQKAPRLSTVFISRYSATIMHNLFTVFMHT